MIQFIKILEYEIKNKASNFDYEYVCDVTLQNKDPESLHPNQLNIDNVSIVFHSPLKRSVQCLNQLSRIQYIPVKSLKEIKFDMKQLATAEQILNEGSLIVRKRWKQEFVNDNLCITRNQIFQEVNEILKLCISSKFENIAIVSHTFRLKIIEAFIKTKGEIKNHPSLINDYLFDNQRSYPFGQGFTVDNSAIESLISL
jgi:hypothetical protein